MNVLYILDFYVKNGLYQRSDYLDKIRHLLYFTQYENIDIEIINDYCRYRKLSNVKNATINRELTVIRSAINYYNKHKNTQIYNPFNGFKLFESDFIPRYLNEEECKDLLMASIDNLHLHAFITLALNTGSRAGELKTLQWENVFMDEKFMTIRNSLSKNKKTVHKPLNKSAIVALERLKKNNNSEWVFYNENTNFHFITFRRSFKKACEKANLENIRIHDLRHTFASLLVQRGVPIYHIMQLLGHSDIKTTQKYAHLANNHLAYVVDLLPKMG